MRTFAYAFAIIFLVSTGVIAQPGAPSASPTTNGTGAPTTTQPNGSKKPKSDVMEHLKLTPSVEALVM